MEDNQNQAGTSGRNGRAPRAGRRVPAYFTVYLLHELLSTLGFRQRH